MTFLTAQNPQNVNMAAFATIVTLAGATVAAAIAAATTASAVSTVALTFFAITGAAVSTASITAYLKQDSVTVEKYFDNVRAHSGYAIAGAYQLVAQTLVQALVEGLARGVMKAIERKISGPDRTYGRA